MHLFPSLAVPKLFSILTFEFPSLIRWVESVKPIFVQPTTRSPYERPPFFSVLKNIFYHPDEYFTWIVNGFTSKLAEEDPMDELKVKEERVARFYSGIRILSNSI